jgi:hypothetical protein
MKRRLTIFLINLHLLAMDVDEADSELIFLKGELSYHLCDISENILSIDRTCASFFS